MSVTREEFEEIKEDLGAEIEMSIIDIVRNNIEDATALSDGIISEVGQVVNGWLQETRTSDERIASYLGALGETK